MKQFQKVQRTAVKKSAFDLSHERKTTLNMGELVPTLCHEVLPGDRFKIDFESFLRTMPLVSPVMHRVNVSAHAFFVPMRHLLAQNRWENFITGKDLNPLPSISQTAFTANYKPVAGDLLDHLNYGVWIGAGTKSNANMSQLPIRAYHKIWNDWYRDQNFQTEYDFLSLPDVLTSGIDYTTFYTVRKRAWEKDYFTAALPSQQRGTDVALPLGSYAPVRGKSIRTGAAGDTLKMERVADHANPANGQPTFAGTNDLKDSAGTTITVQSGLEADLSNATGATISALRRAFALQRWYEASMRFGQRYVEQLLGLFGVVPKDGRLQRSEFLAGGKLPVQIGEVLQTSQTDTTPQGTMTGKGLSAGHIMHIDKTFDEHGYVMIIVSVTPRTAYIGQSFRQNRKLTMFDFAFPQLAHLSEQPVYVNEVFNYQADTLEVFGYQPQYSEYRYINDTCHGHFRDTLTFWSLGRDFAAKPGLNESFITCQPRTDIWPVAQVAQQLLLQSYCKFTAIRPLPKYGSPI